MNYLVIFVAALWIYILTVLKRGKLDFWFFLVGSVGFFVFSVIILQPLLTVPMQKAVAAVAGIMGQLTGMYDSYFQYGILFIQNGGDSVSMYIDYECAGIIEVMAFTALLWFFPVYNVYEKIMVNILGFLAVFISNVLRIFLICVIIYCFGNNAYFVAHTIIGRIFFYGCSVALYFYVFTKPQIIRQKVGKFRYEGNH